MPNDTLRSDNPRRIGLPIAESLFWFCYLGSQSTTEMISKEHLLMIRTRKVN